MGLVISVLSWSMILVISRSLEGTWFKPGSVLAASLGYSAIAARIVAPEYYTSLRGDLYLQAMVIMTLIGSQAGRIVSLPLGRAGQRRRHFLQARRPVMLFCIGMAAAVVSLGTTMGSLGVRPTDLFTLDGVWRVAQSSTLQRYTEGLDLPLTNNLANSLLLGYAIVLAMLWATSVKLSPWMVLPLAIYVVSNLLITTRAPILFLASLMAFSAVYAAHQVRPEGWLLKVNIRVVMIAIILVLLVSVVFFVFQVLRFGEGSTRSFTEVWLHLRRWPLGNVAGFYWWIDGNVPPVVDRPAGFYTFMGIFDNLGLSDRVSGGYQEYVHLTATEPSNVYTAGRGLWHDFGAVGTLAVVGIFGFLGAIAFPRPLQSLWGPPVYILVMCFMAWFPVASFLAYTSNIIAVVLFILISRITCRLEPQPLDGHEL